jgi:hypothetical protein
VTPASMARALSTVNSRLVRRCSSLIATSWDVHRDHETCHLAVGVRVGDPTKVL